MPIWEGEEGMAATSPINPEVLRWAMKEDGRPIPDLAEKIGVPPAELEGWLGGYDQPTQGELSRLSDALGRSRAALLLPEPPVAATTPTAFRRAIGSDKAMSARARRAVRESRQIQKALSWIRRDDEPVTLPRAMFTDKAEAAAAQVREWMAVTVDEQFRWSSDRDALREWRSRLDEQGVFVFALQIGKGEIRGFSDWDDRAPVIGINTSDINPAARIFSIAHELGHLACRSDSTCDEFDVKGVAQSKIETWCESFAGAFLMPPDAVRDIIREQSDRSDSPASDLDKVRLVMRRFRVSARAAAIRLENLNLAPKGLYNRVNHVFVPKASSGGQPMSPPRAVMRIRQYGPDVIWTVMTSLPPRDALRILRIDALDARRIAEEVPEIDGF